jgi:hypothetical protein
VVRGREKEGERKDPGVNDRVLNPKSPPLLRGEVGGGVAVSPKP